MDSDLRQNVIILGHPLVPLGYNLYIYMYVLYIYI